MRGGRSREGKVERLEGLRYVWSMKGLHPNRMAAYLFALAIFFPFAIRSAQTSPKALAELHEKAGQGDAKAQYKLGLHYHDEADGPFRIPEDVKKDLAEAVKWWHKSALQGHAQAQCSLGSCYSQGRGVKQNDAEALKWCRLAAAQGDAEAQHCIASMYEFGAGVKRDKVEALKWRRLAAAQHHPVAQYEFGVMYQFGEGAKKDIAKAVEWYELAAMQDHESAQGALGCIYRDGFGIERNRVEAYAWFDLQAEIYPLNRKWREEVAKKMSAPQIAAAKKRSVELRALIDAKIKK